MRAMACVGLVLGMLLSGCAGERDAPPAGSVGAGPDSAAEGRSSEAHAAGEFAGVLTGVTSVNAAGSTHTDYFFEGDHQATVDEGATELRVAAELTGATPSEWEMCVSQGDPHAGICVVGSSRLEVVVNGTALATGGWSPWFFLPDGSVPVGAGAAVEIRWTATVVYA